MKRAQPLPVIVAAAAVAAIAVTGGAPAAVAGSAAVAPEASETAQDQGASPDRLLALVPADAAMVMWIDFASLSAEGRSFLPPMLPATASVDLLELAAATGINPQRDVSQLVLALLQHPDADSPLPTDPVLIAQVAYGDTRLSEVLADKPTEAYRDHTLYSVDVGGLVQTPSRRPAGDPDEGERTEGNEVAGSESERKERRRARARQRAERRERPEVPGAVTLLGDDLVLVGTLDGVRSALDVADGERPSFLDGGELAEHVRAVPAGRDTIMALSGAAIDAAVRLYSEHTPRSPLATGLLPRLRGVLLSSSTDLELGIEATLTALLPTEQDAKMLADSLTGLLALWKMSLQQEDPELLGAVDRSLAVQHRAERVDVDIAVSPEDSLLLQVFLVKRFGTWFGQRGELGGEPEDTERD